ncbi:MAG TPA: nucleoside-diphosphate sugar epimerase [Ruminococcaceae bacterium]|nr:nucleoside-diphosphate sugar epimerase [Oscillospiraceae bacterium]
MRMVQKLISTIIYVVWDMAAVTTAVVIGLGLRFGFSNAALKANFYVSRAEFVLLAIVVLLLCNVLFRCYRDVWSRSGLPEYLRQIGSIATSTVILLLFAAIFQFISYEILILIAILELFLILAIRVSVRAATWAQMRIRTLRMRNGMNRVLIYGAGEAGVNLWRRLVNNPEDKRLPVCFMDDNQNMWGKKAGGLQVVGGRDKLDEIVHTYNIGEVILAFRPDGEDHDLVKKLLMDCHRLHCQLKRYGGIDDVNESSLSGTNVSDLNLEDLLKRDSVHLNMEAVNAFVKGKTVLVTGGAGSIGSEICRQVLDFGAKELLIFDIFENGLYAINNELLKKYPRSRYRLLLGSIRDVGRLQEVFDLYHPQVIFHAAAHKHVPMMEYNPCEALKNNVFGTLNVARAAIAAKAEKFILISTDKAVNPANIMGASKRIAEMCIRMLSHQKGTDLAAVRFGNVLGSSGSVVPFFKKQIENGGPVTVTHPEMRRYFMTIPEAVQLVMEAGAMAHGGEIFVLDMGRPVLIYDLACDLIRLSGYEPEKDIQIIFTGLRPGEKLFEEISLANEDVTKTSNNKIYICKSLGNTEEHLRELLDILWKHLQDRDEMGAFECVRTLVPTFHHSKFPCDPYGKEASSWNTSA